MRTYVSAVKPQILPQLSSKYSFNFSDSKSKYYEFLNRIQAKTQLYQSFENNPTEQESRNALMLNQPTFNNMVSSFENDAYQELSPVRRKSP